MTLLISGGFQLRDLLSQGSQLLRPGLWPVGARRSQHAGRAALLYASILSPDPPHDLTVPEA